MKAGGWAEWVLLREAASEEVVVRPVALPELSAPPPASRVSQALSFRRPIPCCLTNTDSDEKTDQKHGPRWAIFSGPLGPVARRLVAALIR